MNAVLAGNKIAALFSIVVAGIFGAALPFWIRKNNLTTVFVLLNSTAAGAFLGLALLHLFDEATRLLADSNGHIHLKYGEYNLAQICAYLGFVLILFLEHVIYTPDILKHSHSTHHPASEVSSTSLLCATNEHGIECGVMSSESDQPKHRTLAKANKEGAKSVKFSATAFCALLAISIHAVFEGIVVGLASQVYPVWMAALCIVGHKWAESFALTCKFMEANVSTNASIIYLGCFVSTSPIGILIGMAISASSDIVSGIFNGIAAGTILYVASDMTLQVFCDKSANSRMQSSLIKFLFFNFGACLLFVLTIIGMSISPV